MFRSPSGEGNCLSSGADRPPRVQISISTAYILGSSIVSLQVNLVPLFAGALHGRVSRARAVGSLREAIYPIGACHVIEQRSGPTVAGRRRLAGGLPAGLNEIIGLSLTLMLSDVRLYF